MKFAFRDPELARLARIALDLDAEMALGGADGLIAAEGANAPFPLFKASFTTQAAGSLTSLWTATGNPGAGGTPASGAGVVPTNATAGALPFTNPASGITSYLTGFSPVAATAGSFCLVDRCCTTAGLSGTSTSAQTVNSTALTRYLGATTVRTVTVTSGSDAVADTAATGLERGQAISGTGIPTATWVGTVTPGTGYLLSSSPTTQTNVNATANGTSVTLTAPAGANFPCLEVYSALGGTSVTATISYTNQNGVAGQSASCVIPITAKIGLLIPFVLASGDWGVQSVQTVTLSATTGTAGSFGVSLLQVLSPWVGIAVPNCAVPLDFAGCDLAQVAPNACLALIALPSTTSTGIVYCNFSISNG